MNELRPTQPEPNIAPPGQQDSPLQLWHETTVTFSGAIFAKEMRLLNSNDDLAKLTDRVARAEAAAQAGAAADKELTNDQLRRARITEVLTNDPGYQQDKAAVEKWRTEIRTQEIDLAYERRNYEIARLRLRAAANGVDR